MFGNKTLNRKILSACITLIMVWSVAYIRSFGLGSYDSLSARWIAGSTISIICFIAVRIICADNKAKIVPLCLCCALGMALVATLGFYVAAGMHGFLFRVFATITTLGIGALFIYCERRTTNNAKSAEVYTWLIVTPMLAYLLFWIKVTS